MIAATNWIFCSMPFESSSQRFPSTPPKPDALDERAHAAFRLGDVLQARDVG